MGKKKSQTGKKKTKKMPADSSADRDLQAVFDALRALIAGYESRMVVVHDKPRQYYLDTPFVDPKNKKPVFFAAVSPRKDDIAFHFMPVYIRPDLLQEMSPELKKRMQGKSCFNFKKVDRAVLRELDALVKAGIKAYENAGYLRKRARS